MTDSQNIAKAIPRDCCADVLSLYDPARAERMRIYTYLTRPGHDINELDAHALISQMSLPVRTLHERWLSKTGLCSVAFLTNMYLVDFILDSDLANHARYYGSELIFDESTKHIYCMIEGRMDDLTIKARALCVFKTPFSQRYRKTIVNANDKNVTWLFIPRYGLTHWDQSGWTHIRPCSTLTPDQVSWLYGNSSAIATTEAREESKIHGICPILEVLTTEVVSRCPNWALNGIYTLIQKYRHPWLRLTMPDGTFYSAGFGRRKYIRGETAGTGGFMMPDEWETVHHRDHRRIITGIQISSQQATFLLQTIETFQNTCTEFHMISHNCTNFIEILFVELFKNTPSFRVPRFTMSLLEAGYILQPDVVRQLEFYLINGSTHIRELLTDCVPPLIYTLMRLMLSAIVTAIGHLIRGFIREDDSKNTEQSPFTTSLPTADHNLVTTIKTVRTQGTVMEYLEQVNRHFRNARLRVSTPMLVARWQRKQASTRIYEGDTLCFFDNQYTDV
jgi:hypothetical protein